MKIKIQKKVKPFGIKKKSQVITRNIKLDNLLPEVLEMIFKHLSSTEKKNLRETSKSMKEFVDNQQRLRLKVWMRNSGSEENIALENFTKNGFTPPILQNIIEVSNSIRTENLQQVLVYCREKLLQAFYNQARTFYNRPDMKILFTLTVIGALKFLSNSAFSIFNPHGNLEISLTITHMYFGVLWARGNVNTFNFEQDATNFLSLMSRMIWIKKALEIDPYTNVVNTLATMNFDTKVVGVGSRVYFNRIMMKPPIIDCFVSLQGNQEMIDSFRAFINGAEFDFSKADESLTVQLELTSTEARKSEKIVTEIYLIIIYFNFSWLQ